MNYFFKEKPSVFFSHLVSLSNGYNKGNIWFITNGKWFIPNYVFS